MRLILATIALWGSSFAFFGGHHRGLRRTHVLEMGIDVSGLPKLDMNLVPIPPELMADYASSQDLSLPIPGFADGKFLGLDDVQNALIIVLGVAYITYEGRPRGSARSDLVDIRKSTIPGANLGVFSKKFITEGTVLGSFPGFVRKVEDALSKKSNDNARDLAKKYMWALDEETVLDPTNAAGILDLEMSYAGGLIKVDTIMARINEPPPKKDCNVYSKITGATIEIIAERDIFSDEELFVDYGQTFDRTDYEAEQELKQEQLRSKARKLAEEEDMMRLQPILTDEDDTGGVDQDTSNPDGFIRRLAKNEDKFKKAGILTPEEGANIFTELGARGLGVNKEDRELMEALSGKKFGREAGGASVRGGQAQEDVDKFDKSAMDSLLGGKMDNIFGGKPRDASSSNSGTSDDELLEGLRRQAGADDTPDLMESMGGLFGKDKSKQAVKSSAAGPGQGFAVKSTGAPEEQPQPLLSREEADDLQRRLDNLTDEQIEQVFAKMRAALADKMKEDLSQAIEAKKAIAGKNSMPRAAVNDPSVRSKYASELNAIEDELEKIYSDPLGVWQELMANPDKYGGSIDDGDAGKNLASDEEMQ